MRIQDHFLLLTSLLFATCTCAQRGNLAAHEESLQHIQRQEALFRQVYWEFLFQPNVTTRARVTHDHPAKYYLSSDPQISYEFGVQRVTPLDRNLSLALGFRFGLVGRNAAFKVPDSDIGNPGPGIYPFAGPIARENDVTYLSIPAQLEYRLRYHHKTYLFLVAGGSLRFAPLNGSTTGDNNRMEVRLDGNKLPFVNFNGGGGMGILVGTRDFLKVALNLNFDPYYIAKGRFFLETNSSYDTGTYTVRGTSLGLLVTYSRMKR